MLRTRLYLGLLPLLLVIVGMGAYSIKVSRDLAGSLQQHLVAEYRDLLACERMREAARAMSNAPAIAKGGDPLGARSAFEGDRSRFTRELMAQSASSAGRPRARWVEAVDAAFQSFAGRCEALVAGGGTGDLETLQANDAALFRVLHAIDGLSTHDYEDSGATAAQAARLATTATDVLLVAVAVAFALSAVLAWRLAASLLEPVAALTASVEAIGEGDLDRKVTESSPDELGRLARSFNAMAAKLRAYRDATAARVLRTQRTMEATLTSTPDPLFVVSRSGVHEVRNPAAEELARLPEFAEGFPAGIAEPLVQVLATGEHYLPKDYGRVVTLRVGREDRHYLPRILAIGDTLTEFKGAAVVLQDVTKFRLLDDAKTNLVGTVSHELKTPLTSLRMAVYILLEERSGALSPAQRDLLESARDDADRLLRILDSLLDLARLEAGASALELGNAPVGELLAHITGEAGPLVAAAGRHLVIKADPGCGSVRVDRDRIRHVFINLLANAAKYAPEGGAITLSARPAPQGFTRFGVSDEGPGIPAEAVPRLFDRFYRVPGQSKPGAGIGLAIAREVVVAHGGSIACESEPGRGTEFYFLLPPGHVDI